MGASNRGLFRSQLFDRSFECVDPRSRRPSALAHPRAVSGDAHLRPDSRCSAHQLSWHCRALLVCAIRSGPLGHELWHGHALCVWNGRALQCSRGAAHLLHRALVSRLHRNDLWVGAKPAPRPATRRRHHVGAIGSRLHRSGACARWLSESDRRIKLGSVAALLEREHS